jgi:hypothetical protein
VIYRFPAADVAVGFREYARAKEQLDALADAVRRGASA